MNERQVQAIESFAQTSQFGSGARHVHKVATLASTIFDQLSARKLLPSLGIPDRRTLVAACYVHDVGAPRTIVEPASPSHPQNPPDRDRGRASFQTLKNLLDNPPLRLQQEPLVATDRSALLYAVLWHCCEEPCPVDDEEPLVDAFRTRAIAGILRIASALDSPARPAVRDVLVRTTSSYIRFLVRTTDTPEDELTVAQARSGILSEVLGQRIFVQEVVEDA